MKNGGWVVASTRKIRGAKRILSAVLALFSLLVGVGFIVNLDSLSHLLITARPAWEQWMAVVLMWALGIGSLFLSFLLLRLVVRH